MATTHDGRCPFCGAPLEPMAAAVGGREVRVGWRPCGCPRAVSERRAAEDAARRERGAEEARRRAAAYARAGIKPRYMSASSPLAAQIVRGVRSGRGAYIHGPVGTGKTHLAMAAARLAVDAGIGVKAASMLDVLSAVRGTYGSAANEDAVIARYAGCGLLVIDDLGKEPPTAWALSQVFRLIDDRYANMRPVIVTAQFGRDRLAGRLASCGDEETAVAIVSRLCEMCDAVKLDGRDRRISHGG